MRSFTVYSVLMMPANSGEEIAGGAATASTKSFAEIMASYPSILGNLKATDLSLNEVGAASAEAAQELEAAQAALAVVQSKRVNALNAMNSAQLVRAGITRELDAIVQVSTSMLTDVLWFATGDHIEQVATLVELLSGVHAEITAAASVPESTKTSVTVGDTAVESAEGKTPTGQVIEIDKARTELTTHVSDAEPQTVLSAEGDAASAASAVDVGDGAERQMVAV